MVVSLVINPAEITNFVTLRGINKNVPVVLAFTSSHASLL